MRRRVLSRALVAVATVGASTALIAAPVRIDTSDATLTIGVAPQAGIVVETVADLGAAPAADDLGHSEYFGYPEETPYDPLEFEGTGGDDFHATADVTLPAGTYDYDSFTVDRGVTVTCLGATVLRIAGDLNVDGRLEGESPGRLEIFCAGNATITGHDAAGTSGVIFSAEPFEEETRGPAWNPIYVQGTVTIGAAAGARVTIDGAQITSLSKSPMTISATDLTRFTDLLARGDIALDDVTATCTAISLQGAVTIRDSALGDLACRAQKDISLHGTTVDSRQKVVHTYPGGEVQLGGGASWFNSATGTVSVLDRSAIAADLWIDLVGGKDVEVGGDCSVSIRAEGIPYHYLLLSAPYGTVRVAAGGSLDVGPSSSFIVEARDGIETAGRFTMEGGAGCLVACLGGDVILRDGSEISVDGGPLRVAAAGDLVAEGGSAAVHAASVELRATGGSIDLDLANLSAEVGGLHATARKNVRLRGAFSAARDIGISAVRGDVDVAGASLSTASATDEFSGTVRLSTYAAGGDVRAAAASVATGDSDLTSGDIVLQAHDASAGSRAARLLGAKSKTIVAMDGATVTTFVGTLVQDRVPDLTGAVQVTTGDHRRAVRLAALRGGLTGTTDGATVNARRSSRGRVRVAVVVRTPPGPDGAPVPDAESGASVFALDRPGLHVSARVRRRS